MDTQDAWKNRNLMILQTFYQTFSFNGSAVPSDFFASTHAFNPLADCMP